MKLHEQMCKKNFSSENYHLTFWYPKCTKNGLKSAFLVWFGENKALKWINMSICVRKLQSVVMARGKATRSTVSPASAGAVWKIWVRKGKHRRWVAKGVLRRGHASITHSRAYKKNLTHSDDFGLYQFHFYESLYSTSCSSIFCIQFLSTWDTNPLITFPSYMVIVLYCIS